MLEQISDAMIEFVRALSRDEPVASSLPRPSPLSPTQFATLYPDGLPIVPAVDGAVEQDVGHIDRDLPVMQPKEEEPEEPFGEDIARHESDREIGAEVGEGLH